MSNVIDLAGTWRISLAGREWREIVVPSAWEASLGDFVTEGPALYRRKFDLPREWARGRVRLECDAVSFAATVCVNGAEAGRHLGMWSRFEIDISRHVRAGANDIEIEVWKPGARYPLRESLAGFLPDVCTAFGGIWQGIRLRRGESPSRSTRHARPPHRVGANRDVVLIDGKPAHLRGVLDWGWHPDRIAPTFSADERREQYRQMRALGFNLLKLCLYVPDDATFDVADDEGVLVWLELPLWLPNVTPALRELALREYGDIARRLSHHRSIVIVSLGCELDAASDANFLAQLRAVVRKWMPNVLMCDNSGSAEAYGGASTSERDFDDYHFYTDPHFFQPLVNHFARAYAPTRPWIYGEFCDADTFRDFSRSAQWWLTSDTPRNIFSGFIDVARDHSRLLAAAEVRDAGRELTTIGRKQATAIRKFIFEQTRKRAGSGGYVITGWRDTPIATSGIVDDAGNLKFSPREWATFNADRVLVIDRERQRRWTHGGDRPSPLDPFNVWQGERAQVHISLSNGGGAIRAGILRWSLRDDREREFAAGETRCASLLGGSVTELCIADVSAPASPTRSPLALRLHATFTPKRGDAIENSWALVALPPVSIADEDVATSLSPASLGRGVIWLRAHDPRVTVQLPFWREAIHVFEPHDIWARVPHEGFADMRFFGVASDFALDRDKLAARLRVARDNIRPIWRRFDARLMTWSEYLVEARVRDHRAFISTLRFGGGLGDQPNSLATNPMGAWLLHALTELRA